MTTNHEIAPEDAVAAALGDLRTAAAALAWPRSRHGILALDMRHLAGGARCLAPDATDNVSHTYAAAVDAALEKLPSLRARGYLLSHREARR